MKTHLVNSGPVFFVVLFVCGGVIILFSHEIIYYQFLCLIFFLKKHTNNSICPVWTHSKQKSAYNEISLYFVYFHIYKEFNSVVNRPPGVKLDNLI